MLKAKGQKLRGQSLFEVVLALGVITAIIVGVVSLTANSIRNSVFSRNKTLATRFASEATEWLRSQRDADFDIFKTKAQPGTHCLKTLVWTGVSNCTSGDKITGTSLFREVTFSFPGTVPGKTIIEADVRVYWHDAQGDHEVISATNFSDWRQR